MRSASFIHFLSLALLKCLDAVLALDCSTTAFTGVLPSNVTVTNATSLADGSQYGDPLDHDFPKNATHLPALCALQVSVPSSSNSSYAFGLLLPDKWNSRMMATGNTGFGGGINWPALGVFVDYGFAVLSTDDGHNSGPASSNWANNNPETIIDWGHRAMHGSVELAKDIIKAYYNESIQYSYYSACSGGGRQGLKEVQAYPNDFDGVVAGAIPWWLTHLHTWAVQVAVWNLQSTTVKNNYLPADLFPTISQEFLRQCDSQDGVTDGIISEPYSCNFDATALLCNSTQKTNCLSEAQLDTFSKIYNDWTENDSFVFPHPALGANVSGLALREDTPSSFGIGFVENFILNNTAWDWQDFNYDTVQLADRLDPGQSNADDFDLSAFHKAGGKLIHYHGYSDPLIPTGSSIYYYSQVAKTMANSETSLDDFYRMFLIPGMGHCHSSADVNKQAPWYIAGGGQKVTGASYSVPGFMDAQHDVVLAVMAWVENGTAPDAIVATKFTNDTASLGVHSQRPICKYPQQAKYSGSGDVNDPTSWKCQAAPMIQVPGNTTIKSVTTGSSPSATPTSGAESNIRRAGALGWAVTVGSCLGWILL